MNRYEGFPRDSKIVVVQQGGNQLVYIPLNCHAEGPPPHFTVCLRCPNLHQAIINDERIKPGEPVLLRDILSEDISIFKPKLRFW